MTRHERPAPCPGPHDSQTPAHDRPTRPDVTPTASHAQATPQHDAAPPPHATRPDRHDEPHASHDAHASVSLPRRGSRPAPSAMVAVDDHRRLPTTRLQRHLACTCI
jgi:hypothetical protein